MSNEAAAAAATGVTTWEIDPVHSSAGIARLSVESSSSRVTHSTTPSCV